ncbi:MAG: hypothetical protein L6262_04485 [Weeksellaceae bacterium]|nr:hypothetical protein [Weeksellaceae bacterium]
MKRSNRKTLCFTRSLKITTAILVICFWS